MKKYFIITFVFLHSFNLIGGDKLHCAQTHGQRRKAEKEFNETTEGYLDIFAAAGHADVADSVRAAGAHGLTGKGFQTAFAEVVKATGMTLKDLKEDGHPKTPALRGLCAQIQAQEELKRRRAEAASGAASGGGRVPTKEEIEAAQRAAAELIAEESTGAASGGGSSKSGKKKSGKKVKSDKKTRK